MFNNEDFMFEEDEIFAEGGGDAFWIVLYKNEKYYLVEKGCFQE